MKTLTILIPVRNEEENVSLLIKAIEELDFLLTEFNIKLEIIVNDNESNDKTLELLLAWSTIEPRLKIYSFEKNIGFQGSLISGMREASGDALVVFQGDLQDPFEIIPEMINSWNKGHKIVATQIKRRSENAFDKFGRDIFYSLLSKGSGNVQIKNFQDFYLLDRSVYSYIASLPINGTLIRTELSNKFKIKKVISYERNGRLRGNTKFEFRDKVEMALDGFVLNSGLYQKKALFFGFLSGAISLAVGISLFVLFVAGFEFGARGWLSLITVMIFGFSASIFLLTIIIEMVSRVLRSVVEMQSEIYQIKNKINFN